MKLKNLVVEVDDELLRENEWEFENELEWLSDSGIRVIEVIDMEQEEYAYEDRGGK